MCVVLPIQDYLPPAVHEAFLSTLTEFVLLPWREAQHGRLEGASQGGSQVRTPAAASDKGCRRVCCPILCLTTQGYLSRWIFHRDAGKLDMQL
jgi:hypothetical protein